LFGPGGPRWETAGEGGRGVGWSWKVFQKKKIFFFQNTFKYYILISQACPTPAIAMRPSAIFTMTNSIH